jgi:short-subunit dehydrogenase involved in D-alanine esterification of teichoic acids
MSTRETVLITGGGSGIGLALSAVASPYEVGSSLKTA